MNGGVILIGLIVLFFTLWLVGGGPDRPISFRGPYLYPITTTGTSAEAYGQARQPGAPGFIADLVGDDGTPIPVADTSPYRGSITLSKDSSGPKSRDARTEYVTVQSAYTGTAGIKITGWKLVSSISGASMTLPGGTATLRSGTVNQPGDITLAPGGEAIITSGRSPVGGSFRENKCTGYFEQFQDFSPQLYSSCPAPATEFSSSYPNQDDDKCYAFVRGIPFCETETDIPSSLSNSCEQFIESRLTYNGCAGAHVNDTDFMSPTWRVFLSSSKELWNNTRDSIRLLDENGKIVDVLSY